MNICGIEIQEGDKVYLGTLFGAPIELGFLCGNKEIEDFGSFLHSDVYKIIRNDKLLYKKAEDFTYKLPHNEDINKQINDKIDQIVEKPATLDYLNILFKE